MLDTQGAISVYRPAPSPPATPTLVFKSDSNVMIMYGISTTYLLISTHIIYNYLVRYKNPCYLYRDVIFCSTSAAVGLIVRASYWLLGWRIHQTAEVRVAGDLASAGADTQSST